MGGVLYEYSRIISPYAVVKGHLRGISRCWKRIDLIRYLRVVNATSKCLLNIICTQYNYIAVQRCLVHEGCFPLRTLSLASRHSPRTAHTIFLNASRVENWRSDRKVLSPVVPIASGHPEGSPAFIVVWLPLRVTPVTPEVHLSVMVVFVRIDASVFPCL
jgi:hypothetical protein